MEQQQSQSEVMAYPPPLSTYIYTYPTLNNGDTIATNYVHSLTSSPHSYCIPHFANHIGYYPPHPHYVCSNTNCCMIPSDNNFVVRPTVLQETNCGPDVRYGDPRVITPSQVTYQDNHTSQNYDHKKLEGDCKGYIENSNELFEVREDNEKSIDPRIINILEPFRQLYSEREGTLKIMFPGLYAKLSEFFKKVNSLILEYVDKDGERSTRRVLKRSLSLGDASSGRNEMFKVRPIDSEDTLIMSTMDKL